MPEDFTSRVKNALKSANKDGIVASLPDAPATAPAPGSPVPDLTPPPPLPPPLALPPPATYADALARIFLYDAGSKIADRKLVQVFSSGLDTDSLTVF